MSDAIAYKKKIIAAGYQAVDQLIKVAKEKIILQPKISESDDSKDDGKLAADRMKSAAQAKKIAVFEALEIIDKLEEVKTTLGEMESGIKVKSGNYAERRANKAS